MAIPGALGEYTLGETESESGVISPSSIASAEAFGIPVVSGNVAIIGAGGIASGEAFGSPTVQENVGTIVDAGDIASGEAFGTPTITVTYIISPASIASAEVFGVPFLGEVVTYSPVSRAQIRARRFWVLGGIMGNKFASYYYNAGTDSVINNTDNNVMSMDTEWTDENSLATLSANTVTINTPGWYLVYVAVGVAAGVAFNGYIAADTTQTLESTEGYATAMGVTADTIVSQGTIRNTSTMTIQVRLDNHSGQTLSAYVNELTIVKLD
jgi:hypothetical protein